MSTCFFMQKGLKLFFLAWNCCLTSAISNCSENNEISSCQLCYLQRRRKVQKSGGPLIIGCLFLLLFSYLFEKSGGQCSPWPPHFRRPWTYVLRCGSHHLADAVLFSSLACFSNSIEENLGCPKPTEIF